MPTPSFNRSTALVAGLGGALVVILGLAFLAGGVPAGATDPNPCNPCAAKAANPCNPCAAKAANPCNPCAAKATNPCNPCAAKATNPCNPCAARAVNPCNPCGGAGHIPPEKFSRPAGVRVASARADLALGEKLWNDNRLSTNGAACATCHMNYAAFLPSFATPYPHSVTMVKAMSGVDQVEAAEMVQFCMVQPMQAEPLPWSSRELAALAAYVQNIQTGFTPNPCAMRANPCGANPCNPCMGKATNPCNPCAAKGTNPCATKGANPCEMKNPCSR